MKKIFFALLGVALFTGCTAESIEDYETNTIDKTKIERPGTQGVNMDEIDKDKVQRPGSQGNG